MDLVGILISQYLASLKMFEQTVAACPESIWNAPGDKNKFWEAAYHALFFTHLYVSDSEASFVPWTKHREGYEDFAPGETREPYSKEDILEYLAFCRHEVVERVPRLNLEEGFDHRPYGKLELQIYSMRHIMQHTGEMMQRLSGLPVEIDWVGSMRRAQ